MKNSIGKPYEGKLQVRFDEGGADSLLKIVIFMFNNLSRLSGSTLLPKHKKNILMTKKQDEYIFRH